MITEAPPAVRGIYTPHPKQAEALWVMGLDHYRGPPPGGPVNQLLLAGEGGSAKSALARMMACAMADKYPGGHFAIFRRLTADVDKTQVGPFRRELNESGRKYGEWNWNRHEFEWANGSVTEFHHLEHEEDAENLGSYEWVGAAIDESCTFTPKQITSIYGRIRAPLDRWPDWQPVMGLFTVPWGTSFQWHKQNFRCSNAGIPGARAQYGGARYRTPVYGDVDLPIARSWMPVFTSDNPSLNLALTKSGQFQEADSLKRDAIAIGNWDQNIGGFFADTFTRSVHVVPRLRVPPDFVVTRGYDWGDAAPFSCVWIARDPHAAYPTRYVFRECAISRVPTQKQATLILGMSYPDPPARATYADPSIFPPRKVKGRPTGTWHSQELEAGARSVGGSLGLVPANNKRHEGWAAIRQRLAWGQSLGRPPAIFITEDCPILINWLETVERSSSDPEDIVEPGNLTDLRDDVADAFRYNVMGAAGGGGISRTPSHWGFKT